jgi:ParB-like chromosome segregation protein Spo0J
MKIEMKSIDAIKPFENNPRRNDNAVDAAGKSIQEFGWGQPIVVDTENVIVVGHTR